MSKLKPSRKEACLKITMIFSVITCIMFIFLLFCLLFISEKHFAGLAKYHVSIPEKPDISGQLYSLGNKLYSLSEDNYLLVLTTKKLNKRECYYINLKNRVIGIPLFGKSKYPRFIRNSLIIDEFVLQGYYEAIELNADREINNNELHVQIKDFPTKEIEYEKIRNIYMENFFPQKNPMAYQEWIVLTKLEDNS